MSAYLSRTGGIESVVLSYFADLRTGPRTDTFRLICARFRLLSPIIRAGKPVLGRERP
jgi:hypothetical protein